LKAGILRARYYCEPPRKRYLFHEELLKRRSEREWKMTLSDGGDLHTGKGILLVLLDSASPHSQIDRVVKIFEMES